MKAKIFIAVFAVIALYSCNSGPSKIKAVPGAGSEHLYELMDEDSTDMAADTVKADSVK